MPHDRFYGIAAAELAEQRPDRDLLARAYALALGDPDKSKAIYIGIRAERLEEEAMETARRDAELERLRIQRERERAREEAKAPRKQPLPQKVDLPAARPKVQEAPKPEAMMFSDPEIAKAVQAMRDALAASGGRKG